MHKTFQRHTLHKRVRSSIAPLPSYPPPNKLPAQDKVCFRCLWAFASPQLRVILPTHYPSVSLSPSSTQLAGRSSHRAASSVTLSFSYFEAFYSEASPAASPVTWALPLSGEPCTGSPAVQASVAPVLCHLGVVL